MGLYSVLEPRRRRRLARQISFVLILLPAIVDEEFPSHQMAVIVALRAHFQMCDSAVVLTPDGMVMLVGEPAPAPESSRCC